RCGRRPRPKPAAGVLAAPSRWDWALLPVSRSAPRSRTRPIRPTRRWPATSPIRATPPPFRWAARAVTGRASRSSIRTATWSATAVRASSARRRNVGNRNYQRPGGRSAGVVGLSIPHPAQHIRGRPAIELEAVRLLESAERKARLHAGLAVDLVLIKPLRREHALHPLEIGGLELHHFLPRRFERAFAADAIGEMA